MKRKYNDYRDWECYKNGMYATKETDMDELHQINAERLLSTPRLFLKVALDVLSKWPISTSEHLTNTGCNRQAWIGQSACCYNHDVRETVTRRAWANLSPKTQELANEVADIVIKKYERENRAVYKDMGRSMLF